MSSQRGDQLPLVIHVLAFFLRWRNSSCPHVSVKMAPSDPCLWFPSSVVPGLVSVTHGMWQRKESIISEVVIKKTVISIWCLAFSLFLLYLLFWGKPAAMLWVVLGRGPCGELPPLASSHRAAEDCHQVISTLDLLAPVVFRWLTS